MRLNLLNIYQASTDSRMKQSRIIMFVLKPIEFLHDLNGGVYNGKSGWNFKSLG